MLDISLYLFCVKFTVLISDVVVVVVYCDLHLILNFKHEALSVYLNQTSLQHLLLNKLNIEFVTGEN